MKRNKALIIGSRKSKLALAQAQVVRDSLKASYPESDFEIKTITTTGDKALDLPLFKIGDKGLFTKEIEEALLAKEADIAVHSMKDLPIELPPGLKIAAVMEREDPREALVSAAGLTLNNLSRGARVGTSSLRRSAQLLRLRDDLKILDLRGNLDTRVRKLEQGLFDAVVLAYCGIKRLGLDLRFSLLPLDDILPQAGQGALGIEIRSDDQEADNLVKALDDPDSHLCIDVERALLSAFGGGCQIPVGVCAQADNKRLSLKGGVFSLDGKSAVRGELSGDKERAQELGRELANVLFKKGAQSILDGVLNA